MKAPRQVLSPVQMHLCNLVQKLDLPSGNLCLCPCTLPCSSVSDNVYKGTTWSCLSSGVPTLIFYVPEVWTETWVSPHTTYPFCMSCPIIVSNQTVIVQHLYDDLYQSSLLTSNKHPSMMLVYYVKLSHTLCMWCWRLRPHFFYFIRVTGPPH